MFNSFALISQLADGRFHSGETLAKQQGVSRMSICKVVHDLQAAGLEVDAVRGRGYRLRRPIELLETSFIHQQLSPAGQAHVADIELFPLIDSTNRYLLQKAEQGAPTGLVCLAESQSDGKGRRGRHWVSPFGASIYVSLLWRFPQQSAEIGGLSLLAGIAIANAIKSLGVDDVKLKWPNDLVWQDRKLGGILLEMAGELGGACHVVIGVGINVAMPDSIGRQIDQPWVDLATILPAEQVSRNQLAAAMIDHLMEACDRFGKHGLEGLTQDWQPYDATHGRAVEIQQATGVQRGISCGIDEFGRIVLDIDHQRKTFSSGDVSLSLNLGMSA